MADELARPPWDTSKQTFNTVSPADKENREWMRQALSGGPSSPGGAVLSDLVNSLPDTWEGLKPGDWWNNGGIPTRVEG